MKKGIFIIIIVIILIVGYFVYQYDFNDNEILVKPFGCTMEAKLCSDGSSVGRVGPTCQFEDCPDVSDSIVGINDLIIIENLKPNQEIESPLIIKGKARGVWFFEADFPVILTNWDGLIIAESYAVAQSSWMTGDFVEFEAEIKFEKPDLYDNGSLIFKKDNPSGLPENDNAFELPITFK